MKKVNLTDFKSNMDAYLDMVVEEYETIIIKRSRNKGAVILSQHEYDSIMETLYLLGSKANAERLFESIDQMKKSKFSERDLLEDQ